MTHKHYMLIGLSLLVLGIGGSSGLGQSSAGGSKGIYLIVRGDDIGSSHTANVACIKSYKEGIVRSVEVMTPCAWFPEAVKMLNANRGLDTAEMQAIGHKGYYDVAKDRNAVTEIFVSDKVKKKIKDLNINLISYADLKKARKR